ncbi:MAG TPA: DNA-processing protein DprA [Actinomycetota bacterium]|nr:DNA-processing protein DprA [Actinomycetota bacterium]
MTKAKERIIRPNDNEWPHYLKEIPDPPKSLHLLGLPINAGEKAVAIVGTRRPTAAGIHAARTLAAALAQAGFAIVSGLAMGIDAVAHNAALEVGGYTVAVMGCGISRPYPKSNLKLHERIAELGTLVSEYPSETPPQPGYFPQRNRIIAGLSAGVIVIEGGVKSGARITAARALDYNRNVFAVPGSIRNPMAKCPNELIRNALATLITDAKHVTDDLAPGLVWSKPAEGTPTAVALDEREVDILGFLDDAPVALDVICREKGLTFGEVALALSRLEVRGFVRRTVMGYELAEGGLRARSVV